VLPLHRDDDQGQQKSRRRQTNKTDSQHIVRLRQMALAGEPRSRRPQPALAAGTLRVKGVTRKEVMRLRFLRRT
jgi:hypothetical protein